MLSLRTGLSSMLMVTLAVAALLIAAPGRSAAAPPAWRYTMAAFSNASETDMDVYESSDATNFRPVRRPAFRPPFGLARDPSIMRHTDGFYYAVYTTGWDGTTIGFARSPDRANWTFLRYYPIPFCCVGVPGTGSDMGSSGSANSSGLGGLLGSAGSSGGGSALSPIVTHEWAPEWFVDGGRVNIIVSLSSGGGFVPYMMTALDPSLTVWGLPVQLTGIGANHIDTFVVRIGPVFHAFTKNEGTRFVEHATAPTPTGPYTFAGTGNWAGWGSLREGQSLVQLPDGRWRIYLDGYIDHRYYYSDSSDGFRTWSRLQVLPGLSGFVRHFTVMREPA